MTLRYRLILFSAHVSPRGVLSMVTDSKFPYLRSPRSGKSRPNGVWISELRLVNIRNRVKILMVTYFTAGLISLYSSDFTLHWAITVFLSLTFGRITDN